MTRARGLLSVRLAGIILFLVLPVVRLFAQPPALPIIPAYSTNILGCGAVGDGVTTNTAAIQTAINSVFKAGGGTVEIPAGTFLSGPLNFSNSVNLQLDGGAILRMLPYGSYPGGEPATDFLTSGSSGHDLEVSGTGTIDGQSENSGWWTNNLPTSERPALFFFEKCNRVLIENVTLENPPSMHLVFKDGGGNITIQGITINTPGTSPNTDGMDLVGTNCVVQNCAISDGDDCIALGSTSATSSGTLVTNCAFGNGHGLTVGSNTEGGVSNLLVVNCSFNGTQYGIRMKSDNSSSSGGAGGVAQNLTYLNLEMTNIVYAPIVIYSYYNEYGTPIGFTPQFAAAQAVAAATTSTCIWRGVLISNLTATVSPFGQAGVIWGRTELAASNIVLNSVNITAPATFNVFNARGVQFVNSQVTVPGYAKTFTIYNAGLILTNDTAAGMTLDGLTSTNTLALDNASLSTTATDLFAANPVTVNNGTLAVANEFLPPKATAFSFALGTNASTVAVEGDLVFSNLTINVTNAPGFGAGLYTLFTYTGNESGPYALGSAPAPYTYLFETNTAGQIQLVVSPVGMSLSPVSLVSSNRNGQLAVSWPADHTGWFLELQTNAASAGLGTNWTLLPQSAMTNAYALPVVGTNECVFVRLVYP